MSQRNIAMRMVSPGPAVSKSRAGRSSTVGSPVRVGGEEKQVSTTPREAQPDFPARAAGAVSYAVAGTAASGAARHSDAAARTRLRMRTDTYPRDMPPSSDPIDVPIRDESIRLGQFLKLANLVETGAEAKPVIADGAVLVNGEVETRRGRQLVPGDVVTLGPLAARVATGEVEIDVPWLRATSPHA